MNAKLSNIHLKKINHFSMTSVNGVVKLSISEMIRVFLYTKDKNYMVNCLK